MYDVMGAMRGCRAVKFYSCNNLLSSVHIILIILRYVRLNIKVKNYYFYFIFKISIMIHAPLSNRVWRGAI